jgi:molecular chaperone DnaK (HSP70)
MFRVQNVQLGERGETILPTALAFHKKDRDIRIGESALAASSDDYDLLLNWKLYLGKSRASLGKERAENESLSRILDRWSLEDIATSYFEFLRDKIRRTTAAMEKPQFIIGIPAITDAGTDWRARYKRTIERAFDRSELPPPRFFPEPFAAFQYHWHKDDFPDIGRHQNVLIVDIGGGTTNVCFIQTTQHGRLARGGPNHLPQGVRSIEVGGSHIDRFILEWLLPNRLGYLSGRGLLSASRAKEKISARVGDCEIWDDEQSISRIAEEIEAAPDRFYTLTASDLRSIVESKLWPMIFETVRESVRDIRSMRLANPIDSLDAIVLAGGTCQLTLIESLFRKATVDDPLFRECRYLRSKDFAGAVTQGLAIEAYANSRLHDIKPTRVAPYLQEDIRLLVSHRKDKLEVPRKLHARTQNLSTKLKRGVLISAPQDIPSLLGKKYRWSFSLAVC